MRAIPCLLLIIATCTLLISNLSGYTYTWPAEINVFVRPKTTPFLYYEHTNSLHSSVPEATQIYARRLPESGPLEDGQYLFAQSNRRISEATRSYVIDKKEATATPWYTPLVLSTVAGMSTSLGAALVFFLPRKRVTPKGAKVAVVSSDLLCFSLSLAGSVMVTISIISLLPQCFTANMTPSQYVARFVSIALGCLLCKVLSRFFPEQPEDILWSDHSTHDQQDLQPKNSTDEEDLTPLLPNSSFSSDSQTRRQSQSMTGSSSLLPMPAQPSWTLQGLELKTSDERKSWRIAMFLFFALLAHNFPEGLAVAASAAQSKDLGITVTIGIMIHNIPEGIAIAIPCMKARPDAPWLAFVLASVSGLAEPLGAAVTMIFLRYAKISSSASILSDGTTIIQPWITLEDVLAFVAGIMSMVAVCELFPEARRHIVKASHSLSSPSTANVGNAGSKQHGAASGHDAVTPAGASEMSFYGGALSGFLIMLLTEWCLD